MHHLLCALGQSDPIALFFAHKQHVGIGQQIELTAAQPSHRHDCQSLGRAGHGKRCRHGIGGGGCDLTEGLVHIARLDHVSGAHRKRTVPEVLPQQGQFFYVRDRRIGQVGKDRIAGPRWVLVRE